MYALHMLELGGIIPYINKNNINIVEYMVDRVLF